jgi:[protein-PII] uridylyltransferase
MIEVASDDLYQRNPHAILETFLLYQTPPGCKNLSRRARCARSTTRAA